MIAPTREHARFGPVDLYLLALPEEQPDAGALDMLADLADSGLVRLLDLVLLSTAEDGTVSVIEADDLPGGFVIDVEMLGATGLAAHEDIAELAASIPAGTAALLVAIELVYQRELAARAADSGAVLLRHERIPAPVVNALIDAFAPNKEV